MNLRLGNILLPDPGLEYFDVETSPCFSQVTLNGLLVQLLQVLEFNAPLIHHDSHRLDKFYVGRVHRTEKLEYVLTIQWLSGGNEVCDRVEAAW